MATIKSYTDLEQSKKLTEILPTESADMVYNMVNGYSTPWVRIEGIEGLHKEDVCAWSLAALFNYLREIGFFPNIEADEHGVTMSVCYYDDEEGELLHPMHDITTEADNFVDACYEMIIKLHEQNII